MRIRRKKQVIRMRGLSAIEVAVGIAIVGALLAIAIPAFVRNMHSTYFAEAIEGLSRLSDHAVLRAQRRSTDDAFPKSAPMTPPFPPRAHKEIDPPGTWANPTWIALDFQASPEGAPHAFAYGFDSTLGKDESTFTAHAHADLDGDGHASTLEMHGQAQNGIAHVLPGLVLSEELE